MQCSNCGKKNSVVINAKRYCADCGNPSSKKTKQLTGRQVAGILDLSKHHAKIKSKIKGSVKVEHELVLPKKPGRAQNIHGIRRPALPRHAPTRMLDAAHVLRSHKIKKFATAKVNKVKSAAPVTPMAAHHSYAVTPRGRQVSDYIAKQRQTSYVKPVAHATHSSRTKPSRWQKVSRPFKQRRRASLILAGGLSVLLLGAYVTYLNLPNIQFRVAANRAGIDAQVPRYTPAGYDFGGAVAYSPGHLTIRFNSNSDDNYLDIAQQKTDWDSQSLLENFVLPKSEQYSTFRENGLTIYLFNTNHAAWVNSGIFYSIDGKTKLNPEQILKIASSL